MGQSDNEDEITTQESSLIERLRERVENELPESIKSLTKEDQDLYLVRWIRARDNHLDNATKMLRTSLEWRKEMNADHAAKLIMHPFFIENYPYKIVGANKKGHPVITCPLAEWDFRKVLNDPERLEEFDTFVTYYFEIICQAVRKEHLRRSETGHKQVTQFMFVLDVKNYPYGQILSFGAMKKILRFASAYEAHYPEILYKAIFINCPSYFSLFIKMLKPVIAPKTLGKLTCYSKLEDWQEVMEEILDPDILPERYGGTAKSLE